MRTVRRPAQQLRIAIDCLPERTRIAMLEGIAANRIIVGAYTDKRGGVCPMLAAHRRGGRTDLAAFAKAWDHYTGVGVRSRIASARELRALRAMLEASLAERPDGPSLGEEVERVQAARRAEQELEARETGQGFLSGLMRREREREQELV